MSVLIHLAHRPRQAVSDTLDFKHHYSRVPLTRHCTVRAESPLRPEEDHMIEEIEGLETLPCTIYH